MSQKPPYSNAAQEAANVIPFPEGETPADQAAGWIARLDADTVTLNQRASADDEDNCSTVRNPRCHR